MKTNAFTTIIIEAEENGYLTQISDDIDLKDRLVAKKIALGKHDSPDNWKEISREEGDDIKAEQEKLMRDENYEGNQEQ